MAATSAVNSSLALSGLASGLNWTNIINELLQVQAAPETQMQAEETTNNNKKAAYQAIGTALTSLSTDVQTLSESSFFDSRTANSSNTAAATATASAGTPVGTYNFNITKVATDSVQQGSANVAGHLSATSDVSSLTLSAAGFANPVTAGKFTVNGQTITLATSDTLGSVLNQIGAAINGTASYDPTTDEITLSSSSPIILGSPTDTSNFLQVAQLYNNGAGAITSTAALGGINTVDDLADANFATAVSTGNATTSGQFEINGVTINYDTANDGVSDVLSAIDNSAAGVTANYDPTSGTFQLVSKTTGNVGMTLQDLGGGNLLQAMGLTTGTLQAGDNLEYTLNNGGTLISQSNTISAISSGITGLTVTANAPGAATITVGSDTSTIASTISSFVTDYNAVQNLLSTDVKPTTNATTGNTVPAVLTGDLDTEEIGDQLRQMTSAVPGLSGVIQSLNDLGISSNGTDNTLATPNSTVLQSLIGSNLQAVKTMFTDPTTGIAAQIDKFLGTTTSANGVLSSKGLLANDETNMANNNTTLASSITQLQQQLTAEQATLTNEFTNMETAINSINTEKQYLNAYFSAGSSASSQSAPQAAGSSFNNSSSSSTTG